MSKWKTNNDMSFHYNMILKNCQGITIGESKWHLRPDDSLVWTDG